LTAATCKDTKKGGHRNGKPSPGRLLLLWRQKKTKLIVGINNRSPSERGVVQNAVHRTLFNQMMTWIEKNPKSSLNGNAALDPTKLKKSDRKHVRTSRTFRKVSLQGILALGDGNKHLQAKTFRYRLRARSLAGRGKATFAFFNPYQRTL